MKKPIPVPAVVAAVAAVLVVAFLVFRGASGPAEFPAPTTSKTIPRYIWDGMTPAVQEKMRQEGMSPGEVAAPSGAPSGATAPAGRKGG